MREGGDVHQGQTRWFQILISLGCLALAAVLAWGARELKSEAGYAGVAPNFMPYLMAAALALCGVLLLLQALRSGFHALPEREGKADVLAFVWVSAGVLINAALITRLGFILSCMICYVLAVRGLRIGQGQRESSAAQIVRDVLVGLLICAPVYWLFSLVLNVRLPGLTDSGWL